ncbi:MULTISPECIES: sigma-70 family RNA polymerase sigma factor [Pseudonocardia]|uniref:ECF RNA polymerase sigma factor SigJ n=2 Tax=Pseudonocardia TaxID=1847 RepID=A0A1Y2N4R2_PSEAH|nr:MULTISPECIES: sigma-70 family RNA polymerase sigma factor [Pseudonocardia]OSY42161.1 ECF RNA polymerase sigma factor SigJ [Pseudonocardia autotrophica]TDN75071.1 RNA polymerase sigma-70 factor (ECF subfamily) [Pseudonocardia autotrophica]BBF99015.1 DNA-directed RNA polymerase sigma-70 factor [Pseudonocardia autotrophica]GEC23935.1 DNA-directed RNA polymerase sigma-70 factor [Pseudonocardia saturnea]
MDDDELAARFEQHRPRLRAVARRLLGSGSDADDAVQDTWLRLHRNGIAGVDSLGGWLTTVTSRICLDRLRARRETLLGEDTPEHASPDDPASDAVLADSVGHALMVVLDSLSPAERVAFVLHDVFAVPFSDIAPVLDRSTEATKKLAARARHRARLGAANPGDLDGRRRIIEQFLGAVRRGDMAALLDVLAPDAVRHVDPALLAPGRPTAVRGARSIVDEARSLSGPARAAEPATVDGRPGAAVVRDGTVTLVLRFTITDGLISSFEIIAEPARVAAVVVQLDAGPGPESRT